MTQNILMQYLIWHFLDQPKFILKVWGNFLRFNLGYWSIPLLLKTFFSPWRRYQYSYGRGFDLGKYFEIFTFNIISRTMGAIIRTFFILTGLAVELFILFFGAMALIAWFLLPILMIAGLWRGLKILIF